MAEITTKKVKTSALKLNPDNPRRISNKDMERLVKSLQEFPDMMGIREIVCDENMVVLGGNMRLLALRKIGAIYQAGNWIYTGKSAAVPLFQDKAGNFIHDRACSATGYKRQFGKMKKVPNRKDLIRIPQVPKWRYLMPLDDEMRKQIEPLRKPYPKRQKQAMTGDQPEQREGSAHPDAPIFKGGE